MEINENSYKLSHSEAVVALTGSAILCNQEVAIAEDDIKRVLELISNSIAASRMYVNTRLKYSSNQDPSEEAIDTQCQEMKSFISLPKDELISSVLPLAVETYFWQGHEMPGIFDEEKLSVASNMVTQLLCDTTDID
jgi:hypothetical protein